MPGLVAGGSQFRTPIATLQRIRAEKPDLFIRQPSKTGWG